MYIYNIFEDTWLIMSVNHTLGNIVKKYFKYINYRLGL